MCGRVWIKTNVAGLMRAFSFAGRQQGDGLDGLKPRYNGAPGQDYPIIIRELDMGPVFTLARWGLIPSWIKEAKPTLKPINAKCETVAKLPMFRAAYRARRALLPVDGFFEWRAIKGEKVKQPYAIAMKSGQPFAIAVIWEQWRSPETGQVVKTFAVVTCPANALVGQIHDRMPVILAEAEYARWLGEEPDPRELMRPFPAELMTMWPISRRVNTPRNDAPDILEPIGP